MKRIAILLLTLCLLGACSPKEVSSSQPASTKPESGGQKTITLLSFPDQPKQYFEEAIQAAHLNFDVKIMEVPQNQYENKVRMMLSADEAPDLILIDTPNIANYANMGRIAPLDTYWPEEDFQDLIKSSQSAVTWENHRWAAPLNEATVLLFYNRKLLRDAGIHPADNEVDAWTMDELLNAAIRLTKTDSSGKVVQYGLQPVMFSPNNKVEGMAYTQMLYTWWFGSDILSPNLSTATGYFDSPENLRALQFFSDLYNKYHVSPTQEIPNGFENGKIAMYINGPWLIGTWRDNFPDFYKDQWGAMPLPRGIRSACPTGSWNIAMTTQCTDKQEAWKVINAITGKSGMRIWCDRTGNISARQSVIDAESLQNQKVPYNIIYDQLRTSARNRPITPAYPVISEAIIDCFNSVAFGNSPKNAMKDATQKINTAIQNFQTLSADKERRAG